MQDEKNTRRNWGPFEIEIDVSVIENAPRVRTVAFATRRHAVAAAQARGCWSDDTSVRGNTAPPSRPKTSTTDVARLSPIRKPYAGGSSPVPATAKNRPL